MTRDERTIVRIQQQLAALGPVLPGSLNEQWNVCGTPGCRCKDATQLRKHGPYYQLSFTVSGKSSSLFIQKQDLPEARRRIQRYHRLKTLVAQWGQTAIGVARTNGFRSPAR